MLSHAVAKMNGSATGLHLSKLRRYRFVFKDGVQPRSDPRHPSIVVVVRVRGPSDKLSAVLLPGSMSGTLKLLVRHAVLLHEGEPGNPVTQTLLMCSKARRILGLCEEALSEIPRVGLMFPIALDHALPSYTVHHLRFVARWLWALRARLLGAASPVRQGRTWLVLQTCAPEPVLEAKAQDEDIVPGVQPPVLGASWGVHAAMWVPRGVLGASWGSPEILNTLNLVCLGGLGALPGS